MVICNKAVCVWGIIKTEENKECRQVQSLINMKTTHKSLKVGGSYYLYYITLYSFHGPSYTNKPKQNAFIDSNFAIVSIYNEKSQNLRVGASNFTRSTKTTATSSHRCQLTDKLLTLNVLLQLSILQEKKKPS